MFKWAGEIRPARHSNGHCTPRRQIRKEQFLGGKLGTQFGLLFNAHTKSGSHCQSVDVKDAIEPFQQEQESNLKKRMIIMSETPLAS